MLNTCYIYFKIHFKMNALCCSWMMNSEVQLTPEQHEFEPCGSTYMWSFHSTALKFSMYSQYCRYSK